MAHSAELASGRADMTRLEKSVAVAQRHLVDAQPAYALWRLSATAIIVVCFGTEEQQSGCLESLLHGLCSGLVDHMSLVDLVRGFLRHDMDPHNDVFPELYLLQSGIVRPTFILQRSPLSRCIGQLFIKMFSDILTDLNGHLVPSASDPLVKTWIDPLGPAKALPRS